MLYQAKAAGAEIEKIITTNPSGNFLVHSQSKDGFTLVSHKKLIYIGNENRGILPFGIHLQAADYEVISRKKNKSCQFEKQGNQLYLVDQAFEVEIPAEIIYKGGLPCNQIQPIQLRRRIEQLNCLPQFASVGFEAERNDSIPSFQKLLSVNKTELAKGILYYLGRGSGIFPAGDSFLIGLMAVDQILPILTGDFYKLLLGFLADKKWTTTMANTYLKYACKKRFSSSINAVLASLTDSRISWTLKMDELIKLKNSIADDTLAGIIAGMNVYLEKVETNES